MTRLRWTIPAHDDFLGIVAWIKDRNPEAAARVGSRILDFVENLARHPYLGKPGRAPDTRELVVTRLAVSAFEPVPSNILGLRNAYRARWLSFVLRCYSWMS